MFEDFDQNLGESGSFIKHIYKPNLCHLLRVHLVRLGSTPDERHNCWAHVGSILGPCCADLEGCQIYLVEKRAKLFALNLLIQHRFPYCTDTFFDRPHFLGHPINISSWLVTSYPRTYPHLIHDLPIHPIIAPPHPSFID